MAGVPNLCAKSGFKMPAIGFGTWQANEGELEKALDIALETGYRHIDTAYIYLNETVVGNVLQKWLTAGKLKREDLFIVTKLPVIGNRPEDVEKFLNLSLERLQLSYVDLYLVHCPWGLNYHDDDTVFPFDADGKSDLDYSTDIIAVWQKMEEQVKAGKTLHIGVSNFSAEQVGRILSVAEIPPATNQIQLNVYLQQPDLVKYLKDNDIVVTSYSTLGSMGSTALYNAFGVDKTLPNLLQDEVVVSIADEVGKTAGQVLLRFMVQNDIAVIPKSTKAERIQQNFELLDFELSPAQMAKLENLDRNYWVVDFAVIFNGLESHPEFQCK